MDIGTWAEEFGAAITICDEHGVIVAMNEKAARTHAKSGGRALIGANLLDCHPEPARHKLETLLREQGRNSYTIEKAGMRKLIHQGPWFEGGVFRGLVELSIEIPVDMAHFVRSTESGG